jgi:hypothetical protein
MREHDGNREPTHDRLRWNDFEWMRGSDNLPLRVVARKKKKT